MRILRRFLSFLGCAAWTLFFSADRRDRKTGLPCLMAAPRLASIPSPHCPFRLVSLRIFTVGPAAAAAAEYSKPSLRPPSRYRALAITKKTRTSPHLGSSPFPSQNKKSKYKRRPRRKKEGADDDRRGRWRKKHRYPGEKGEAPPRSHIGSQIGMLRADTRQLRKVDLNDLHYFQSSASFETSARTRRHPPPTQWWERWKREV